jgi:hypothetical protein
MEVLKLEDYLRAIKECPDERVPVEGGDLARLTVDFGVYDNWPILLNVVFRDLINDLTNSETNGLFAGQYKLDPNIRSEQRRNFDYVPGTIKIQVRSYPIDTSFHPEHGKRQQNEFTVGMMLHPYQEKKVANVEWTRTTVEVIEDICNYANEKEYSSLSSKSISTR